MELTSPEAIAAAFTERGVFRFARWAVPLAPVVHGVDDASLAPLKAAQRLICDLTGLPMADGADGGFNHVTLYCRDWEELAGLPGLAEGLDPAALARDLSVRDVDRHLLFAFAPAGGILRALHLVRLSAAMAGVPADLLGLAHAVMTHLRWAPAAFAEGLTMPGPEGAQLRPDLLRLLRVAYDPALPEASGDPALAYRLFARLEAAG